MTIKEFSDLIFYLSERSEKDNSVFLLETENIKKMYRAAGLPAPKGKGIHTVKFHKLAIEVAKGYLKKGDSPKEALRKGYATAMKQLGPEKAVKKGHRRTTQESTTNPEAKPKVLSPEELEKIKEESFSDTTTTSEEAMSEKKKREVPKPEGEKPEEEPSKPEGEKPEEEPPITGVPEQEMYRITEEDLAVVDKAIQQGKLPKKYPSVDDMAKELKNVEDLIGKEKLERILQKEEGRMRELLIACLYLKWVMIPKAYSLVEESRKKSSTGKGVDEDLEHSTTSEEATLEEKEEGEVSEPEGKEPEKKPSRTEIPEQEMYNITERDLEVVRKAIEQKKLPRVSPSIHRMLKELKQVEDFVDIEKALKDKVNVAGALEYLYFKYIIIPKAYSLVEESRKESSTGKRVDEDLEHDTFLKNFVRALRKYNWSYKEGIEGFAAKNDLKPEEVEKFVNKALEESISSDPEFLFSKAIVQILMKEDKKFRDCVVREQADKKEFYEIVADKISDKTVADDIARKTGGEVVEDDEAKGVFRVIKKRQQ